MDPLNRLKMLSSQMHLEPAEDAQCPQHDRMDEVYLSKAVLPNGQRIDLLKTLLTSVCERDCYYCPFRSRMRQVKPYPNNETGATIIGVYGIIEQNK